MDAALDTLRARASSDSEVEAALEICLSALTAGGATTNYLLNQGLAELLHDLLVRRSGGGGEGAGKLEKVAQRLVQELYSSEDHSTGAVLSPSDGGSLLEQRQVMSSSAPTLKFLPYQINKSNRKTLIKQALGRKRQRPKRGQGPLVAGMTGSGTAYGSLPQLHPPSPGRLPTIDSATNSRERRTVDNADKHSVASRQSEQQQQQQQQQQQHVWGVPGAVSPTAAAAHSPEVDPSLDRFYADDALGAPLAPPHAAGTVQHSVSYLDDNFGESSSYGDARGGDDPTLPVRLWRGGVELGARSRLILDIYRNEGTKQPTLLSAHTPMLTVDVCDLSTGRTYLIPLSEAQLGQASLLPDILRMHEAPPAVQVSHIERLVGYLGLRFGGGPASPKVGGVGSQNWDESTIQGDSVGGAASSDDDSVLVKQWANLEDQTLSVWRRRMAEQRLREEQKAASGVPKINPDHSTPDERLRAAIQRHRLETQKSIEKSRPKSPTAKVFVATDNKRTDIVVDLQASLMNIEPIKVAPDVVDAMLALFRSLDPLNFGFVATAQFKLVLTLSGSVLAPKEVRAIINQYGIKHPDGLTATNGAGEPADGVSVEDQDQEDAELEEKGAETEVLSSPQAGPSENASAPQSSSASKRKANDTSMTKKSREKTSYIIRRDEKLQEKKEEDDQHGVSPQAIAATVAAARLRPRKEREDAWPIDYERFCLSGRLVRLHGMDKNVPPVAPWAEKLKKNKIEAPADELTWGAHVRHFQQRRMIAVTWLMKRGLRAQRHFVNKALIFQQLKVTAIRAGAFAFIREKVHKALRHEDKKRNARTFLAERQHRVKRHRNLHAETFRLLKKLVQKQIANNRATNFEASNQNRCWMRQYHVKQAQKWLAAKAAVQKRRYIEKTQSYQWLRALGKMATITRKKMDREQVLIETMGRRAVVQSARRHTAFEENLMNASKATSQWYDQYTAADWLHNRARFTLTHLENQAGAFAYLKRLGDGGVRFIFRGQLAQQWLAEAGHNAIKHNQAQYDARAYLKKIKDGAAGVVGGQDGSFQWLTAFVERSHKHLRKCERAKASLAQSVLLARKHSTFMGRAKMELQQMVEEARVNAEMAAVAKANSKRLSELTTLIKEEDKKKAAERKSMPPLVALKLEMEEAFQIFDLDGSGEIDRLEFRHLLRGGALFKLARDEIDDVYTQIDKDRSGAVDFEEFWAWCQFEFSKTPNRKIKVPMILSAKERAERRLLVEVRSKSAGAVRGSGIPPDSSTKPGSPLTIERSPTKERLRQEKKRFLDEDDEEEDDGGSISASIAELEGNSAVESPVEAEAEAGGSVGTSKAGEIHGEIQ